MRLVKRWSSFILWIDRFILLNFGKESRDGRPQSFQWLGQLLMS